MISTKIYFPSLSFFLLVERKQRENTTILKVISHTKVQIDQEMASH